MSAYRQAAFYTVGVLLSRAAPLLTVPLLAHGLTPGEYGRLEMLVIIAEFGGLLAGGGFSATVFRWAASGSATDRARVGSEALGAAMFLAALIAAIGVLFLPNLRGLLPVEASTTELQLLAVSFALAAFLETPFALMRTEGRVGTFTVCSILRLVVQISLMAVLLQAGWGVMGALLAGALASLALSVAVVTDLISKIGIGLPRGSALRDQALYGGPLMLAGLAAFAQNAGDRWLVGETFGAVDLAVYALAVKAALFTSLVLRPYDMWWEANRMRLRDGPDGSARVRKAIYLGIGLAVLAGAVMAIFGPTALRLATPEAYHAAADLIPLAAATGALHAASAYLGAGLFFQRTGFAVLGASVVTAAVALALYATLIPIWGLEGALYARGASALFRAGMFWALSLTVGRGSLVRPSTAT